MATDPININNNADRQLAGGNARVAKLHKHDLDAIVNASGGTPTAPLLVSAQTDFNIEVALGNIPGKRLQNVLVRDSKTATAPSNPKFLWDIDVPERTDITPPGVTLYISSSDVTDVGQTIVVAGVGIVGGKLKEIFGQATSNGQNQVEIVESGTANPILFFRVNSATNVSAVNLLGTLYVAESDVAVGGIPADNKIQSAITLFDDFSPAVSANTSSVGAFTIPEILSTGEEVLGYTVGENSFLTDNPFVLHIRIQNFNSDGTISNTQNLISGQTGNSGSFSFFVNNLFSINPLAEVQYRVLMGSNNQTFTYLLLGTLSYIPL